MPPPRTAAARARGGRDGQLSARLANAQDQRPMAATASQTVLERGAACWCDACVSLHTTPSCWSASARRSVSRSFRLDCSRRVIDASTRSGVGCMWFLTATNIKFCCNGKVCSPTAPSRGRAVVGPVASISYAMVYLNNRCRHRSCTCNRARSESTHAWHACVGLRALRARTQREADSSIFFKIGCT